MLMQHRQSTLSFYTGNSDYYETTAKLDSLINEFGLKKLPGQDFHVLDAGCGSGRDLAALSAAGFKTTGIDICPTAVGMAKEKAPDATIINACFLTHNFTSTFDAIVSVGGFVHYTTEELSQALHRCYKLLNKDGTCAIS